MKSLRIILCFIFLLFTRCSSKEPEITIVPIKNKDNGKVIGDSILVDGKVAKITFKKYTSDDVDSIVFVRNSNGQIIEKNSYYGIVKAFERIEYDEKSGIIKKYSFLSPDCDTCVMEINYNDLGQPIKESGKFFFLSRVDKVDPKTLEVKNDGSSIHFWLYHPNPPDQKLTPYVLAGGKKHYVFKQNEVIDYLKEGWIKITKHDKEFSSTTIGLDYRTTNGDTMDITKEFLYKVVD